jgi:hypothetical protein
MRVISPKDSVLYHEFLYRDSENLIIIGGFKGYNLNRFEYLRNLKTFHVYEPNPEFASYITSNISNLIVHVEAVGQHDGSALLRVSGDHSYLDSVERPSSINISEVKSVKVVSISTALSRLVGQYSMFLNCEGGEYHILQGVLSKMDSMETEGPRTIVFQSHKVTDKPYIQLYMIRQALSHHYIPLLTLDWAWDIWVIRSST